MLIRYPVDGRRRDIDDALQTILARRVEHVDRATHIDGADVAALPQWQGRRSMDHHVLAGKEAAQGVLVAHVGIVTRHPGGIVRGVEGSDVEQCELMRTTEAARQVVAEKSRATGDGNLHKVHLLSPLVAVWSRARGSYSIEGYAGGSHGNPPAWCCRAHANGYGATDGLREGE